MPEPVSPATTIPTVLHGPCPVTVTVCVTCRTGETDPTDEARPGRRLLEELSAAELPPNVTLRPVECLARCDAGCTAALTAPGRWSLLLGNLDRRQAGDLLRFAGLYGMSRTGMVMPSKRPASLANVLLGRIPGTGPAPGTGWGDLS